MLTAVWINANKWRYILCPYPGDQSFLFTEETTKYAVRLMADLKGAGFIREASKRSVASRPSNDRSGGPATHFHVHYTHSYTYTHTAAHTNKHRNTRKQWQTHTHTHTRRRSGSPVRLTNNASAWWFISSTNDSPAIITKLRVFVFI